MIELLETESYEIFKMFNKDWALVTAGNMDDFDTCTIGWGSLGDLWGGINKGKPIVTVYVNPVRYTNDYLLKNENFTVSFFDEEYRDDLMILGTKSKRDIDKVALTKLTPTEVDNSVSFKEAKLTFVCKKIYFNQFVKEHMHPDYHHIYNDRFPPHYEYIGEIIDVIRKENEE